MGVLDDLQALLSGGRVNVSKRFALLREAISGTMSKFYMARDLRNNQIVGLKILDPKKTALFEARFKGAKKPSEGQIAVQLSQCPRIVKTLEHGLTTDGSPYLVMEFLEGPGMNSLIVSRNPQLADHRVKYIRQAAEAVASLHAAGFIHRDICPRNLLLTDGGENLKLIDFGLTLPATKPFMQPGNRTGTPNYMAPEMVRRRPTDRRVDVFAFGVTAYEMYTFQLPWMSGDTGLIAMTHADPPADIRTRSPQIDPELADAIHACIEPNMEKRCPSIDEFLERIRKVPDET